MKFAEMVKSFVQKSTGGTDSQEEPKKPNEETNTQAAAAGSEAGNGNPEKEDGKEMEKSELTDATEILNALVDELKTIDKSLASLASRQDVIEKAQADVGEAVVGVAELVSKIANTPVPTKGTLAKGGLGNEVAAPSGKLDTAEFHEAQIALNKAYTAKRISIQEASKLETEMQKAMLIPGYRMQAEDIALIARELKTA